MKKYLILLIALLSLGTQAIAKEIVIKATTNANETNIGDYWLETDLKSALKAQNHNVTTDYRQEHHRLHKNTPDINIYLRGYTKFTPPFPEGTNILYVYYPLWFNHNSALKKDKTTLNLAPIPPKDTNLDDDLQNYDYIAVASPTYTEKLKKEGIPAHYIPQFTNPEKFYPAPQEDLKTDILFVGSNWHNRTSLRYAIELGFNVAVYGYNWENIVPDAMYKARYIPNELLNRYYSSAKIVLNDHRPDMKEFGFINNRIYDATASGALVISDYMEEIEQIYGDSIPMYKTKDELKTLITYYLSHEEERLQKAKKAREITLNHFTNHQIAKKLLSLPQK